MSAHDMKRVAEALVLLDQCTDCIFGPPLHHWQRARDELRELLRVMLGPGEAAP